MKIKHALAAIRSVLVPVLVLVTPAPAQTVVDASDKNVSPEHVKAIIARFEDQLVDPSSAQIRRMRQGWGDKTTGEGRFLIVCGELNAKNRQGGYNGFTVFMYAPHMPAPDLPTLKGDGKPWLIISSQVRSPIAPTERVRMVLDKVARRNCSQPLHTAEPGD